jgi:hypothetical protein
MDLKNLTKGDGIMTQTEDNARYIELAKLLGEVKLSKIQKIAIDKEMKEIRMREIEAKS